MLYSMFVYFLSSLICQFPPTNQLSPITQQLRNQEGWRLTHVSSWSQTTAVHAASHSSVQHLDESAIDLFCMRSELTEAHDWITSLWVTQERQSVTTFTHSNSSSQQQGEIFSSVPLGNPQIVHCRCKGFFRAYNKHTISQVPLKT